VTRRVLFAVLLAPLVAAAGDEAWKKEFDDVCAQTQDAMALSSDELRALVTRADKLVPQLEALDESQKKVYSRRLKACRDLYQFVLETREQAK
jgi:hypothetical protein